MSGEFKDGWLTSDSDWRALASAVDSLYVASTALEDYLEGLAHLLAGRLGDGCIVDVCVGEFKQGLAAYFHPDPSRRAELGEFVESRRQRGNGGLVIDCPPEKFWCWNSSRDRGEAIADVGDDHTYRLVTDIVDGLKADSLMIGSFSAAEGPVGTLTLFVDEARSAAFAQRDQEFLQTCSHRAGAAVEALFLRELRLPLATSERAEAIATLTAGLAHEINNPLAFVQSNIDFVLRALEARLGGAGPDRSTPSDGDLHEALEDCREGLRRMRSIIDGMRSFGGGNQRSSRTDVEECLSNALLLCRTRLSQIERVERSGDPLKSIAANGPRLTRVFVNLLRNALTAVEDRAESGTIEITTTLREDCQFVEITDDGEGIDPEMQERIFDPFFTMREVGDGAGLGLYIAHNIVTDLGGTITVESTPGHGSSFRVELPIAPSEDCQ